MSFCSATRCRYICVNIVSSIVHYYVLFSFFTWKWIFWNSSSCKTWLDFIPCLSRRGLKMCLVHCASRRTRHAAFIKAVSSSLQRCSCSEAAGARYSNVPSASAEALTAFSLLLVSMEEGGKSPFPAPSSGELLCVHVLHPCFTACLVCDALLSDKLK